MTIYDRAISFLNNANIRIFEVNFGEIDNPQLWDSYNNFLPYNMIYYILEGEILIRKKGQTFYLTERNAYLIPGHKVYDFICVRKSRLFFVHFSYQLQTGFDLFDRLETCRLLNTDAFLPIVEEQVLSMTQVSQIIRIKGVIYSAISDVVTDADFSLDDVNPFYSELVSKILDYINDNLSALLTVNEIANHLGFSPDYISKKFYEECHVGLKKHISTMLYKKSLSLISQGDYSIREISEILHFSDQYYFSRFFKKYHLSPPSTLVKNRIRYKKSQM